MYFAYFIKYSIINLAFSSFFFQTTSSEATFVCLLAARTQAIRRIQEINPELEDVEINSRLVAYCSDQVPKSSAIVIFFILIWKHV